MTYGYIRVSSREQNEGRQLIAMQEIGITEKISISTSSPARIFCGLRIRQWYGRWSEMTCCISKASTGSDGITRKFWSSGAV